jgi:hypothetical protein
MPRRFGWADLLALVGAALVIAGAALWCLEAGLVAAGLCSLTAAFYVAHLEKPDGGGTS